MTFSPRTRALVVAAPIAAAATAALYATPVWRDVYGDIAAHARFADDMLAGRLIIAHPVFHAVTIAVARLTSLSTYAAALLVVVASRAAAAALLVWVLMRAPFGTRPWAPWHAVLGTVVLLLVGPLSLFSYPQLYVGYIGLNVAHNPTTNALIPIALVQFVVVWTVLSDGAPRRAARDVALATALALASGLAKPSFDITILPAMFVFGAASWMAAPPERRRRMLAVCLSMGATVVALIAWQQYVLASLTPTASGEVSGVQFAPLAVLAHWNGGSRLRSVVHVALSMAFPLAVLLAYWPEVRRRSHMLLAWLNAGVALALSLLLAETGERWSHGNFLWSAIVALWLLTVVSLDLVYAVDLGGRAANGRRITLRAAACLVLLALHTLSGLAFLRPFG